MRAYDVIVLGLGGMGTAAAYHLACRGAHVLGIEQFAIAHGHGSSHGRTRIIRQAYHEGPDYVPLVLRAYELWRALEQESGRRMLTITGGLYVGPAEAPAVAGAELSAQAYNIPYERLTASEIRRRFPVLRVRDDHLGVFEPHAGLLVPEDCVIAHAAAADRYGAELRVGETVHAWSAGPWGVRVRTDRQTYEAGRLVITTGPWTAQVLHDLDLPLRVERVVLYWFQPVAYLEEFRRLPVYIWDDQVVRAYGFPYIDGQGLKCAFSRAFTEPTTPQAIRREVSREEQMRIRNHLARFMPDAAGALLSAATCMYTNTPDLDFVIDRHPIHERVIVACGFSGHGFKFCSVVGEVLADLVLDGKTEHPIDRFSLRRFAFPGGIGRDPEPRDNGGG